MRRVRHISICTVYRLSKLHLDTMSHFQLKVIDLVVIVLMAVVLIVLNETGYIGYVQELIMVPVLGAYILGREADRLQAKLESWWSGSTSEVGSE